MTFLRHTLIAAVLAVSTCAASTAFAACTVSGTALSCDTQDSAMAKLYELAQAYVPTETVIDKLLKSAKKDYSTAYVSNISAAKSLGWAASEKSGTGGTTIDADAYTKAYSSYLSGQTKITTGAGEPVASYQVTYTSGLFSRFTANGPLAAALSLSLSLTADTITGAYNYTVNKVYSVAGASVVVSPGIDYVKGIWLGAQVLNLSGDSGYISVSSGDGVNIAANQFGGRVSGYPESGFKVAAVPGPLAGAGLLPALLLGLGMLGLRRRSLAV